MTVKELMNQLKKYPAGAKIIVADIKGKLCIVATVTESSDNLDDPFE